jgi:Mn2+/Fe2+ NRAMP family transporter
MGGVLGGSLLVAAFSAQPDVTGVLKGVFVPSLPEHGGFYGTALLISALVGTEAGSVSNLMYAYLIQEKGWKTQADLPKQRWDLILSISAVFFFGALIQITGAATFHQSGTIVEDSSDLMELMSCSGSDWFRVGFLLSFCAVAFSSFVGFTEGKSLMAADMIRLIRSSRGRRSVADAALKDQTALSKGVLPNRKEVDRSFRRIVLFLGLSPAYFLVTDFRPVFVALAVSAFYTALIPILAGGLLWITNDSKLMRGQVNSWWVNLAMGLLILISVLLTGQNVVEWLR